jgi:hypothetical protein
VSSPGIALSPSGVIERIRSTHVDNDTARQKVSILSLIGFDTARDNNGIAWRKLCEESLQTLKLSSDISLLVTELGSNSTLEDVRAFGGGDVAIVYISKATNLTHTVPSWAIQLQHILDTNRGPLQTAMSVFVVWDEQLSKDEVEQQRHYLDSVLSSYLISSSLHQSSILIAPITEWLQLTPSERVQQQGQWLQATLQSLVEPANFAEHNQNWNSLQQMLSKQPILNPELLPRKGKDEDPLEFVLYNQAVALANDCVSQCARVLQRYSASTEIYETHWGQGQLWSSKTKEEMTIRLDELLQQLENDLLTALKEHRRVFAHEYAAVFTSKSSSSPSITRAFADILSHSLRNSLRQVQKHMIGVLRDEARSFVEANFQQFMRQALMDANEGMPNDGKLLKSLGNDASSAAIKRLQFLTASLHKGLETLLNDAIALSFQPTAETNINDSNIKPPVYTLPVDYDSKHTQLAHILQEWRDTMLASLRLSGGINPYLRTWPFPPVHLNFNYWIDPRTIRIQQEYRNLYDEHKEGVWAPGRAESMSFPGIAAIPFDPHEHPAALTSAAESGKWSSQWQQVKKVVQDLWRDDEEDDEKVAEVESAEKKEAKKAERAVSIDTASSKNSRKNSVPADSFTKNKKQQGKTQLLQQPALTSAQTMDNEKKTTETLSWWKSLGSRWTKKSKPSQ